VTLTNQDIAEIMRLLDQSSFGELKLEIGDLKLHVSRNGALAAPAPLPAQATPPVTAPATPPVPAAPPSAASASGGTLPPPGPGEIDVPSPLLGIFYRAPKPGEAAFVEIGQMVAEDTIIGILEVMKLMNSVRAGVRGEIVAIHAANAEMVEYDQPLIRVRTVA
jgi:acetyl-CoA carboxylase biotin carboxyl carrier protein